MNGGFMGAITQSQETRKLPFRDFCVEWRENAKINQNVACRHFNANHNSQEQGDEDREVICSGLIVLLTSRERKSLSARSTQNADSKHSPKPSGN